MSFVDILIHYFSWDFFITRYMYVHMLHHTRSLLQDSVILLCVLFTWQINTWLVQLNTISAVNNLATIAT